MGIHKESGGMVRATALLALLATAAASSAQDVKRPDGRVIPPIDTPAPAGRSGYDPNATEVIWCQDEPQNQGAWFYVQHYVHENMVEGQKLAYAGRPASASPAVGYAHLHQEQQKALIDQAFGKMKGFVISK